MFTQAGDRAGRHIGGIVFTEDILLSNDIAAIDFTNINQAARHLMIIIQGRSTVSAILDNVKLNFNGDVGNNYDYEEWAFGTGSSFPAAIAEAFAQAANLRIMSVSGATSTTGDVGSATVWIPNYNRTTANKNMESWGGVLFDRTAGNIRMVQGFGSWRSSAPIIRATFTMTSGSWAKNVSAATLYGFM